VYKDWPTCRSYYNTTVRASQPLTLFEKVIKVGQLAVILLKVDKAIQYFAGLMPNCHSLE
jgi:hypothetical protein